MRERDTITEQNSGYGRISFRSYTKISRLFEAKLFGKAKHDKMVSFVERMLELHKKLNAAKVPDEKIKLQRQIDATDAQIDKLVYELYGLTAEEIKIVEGGEATKIKEIEVEG